MATDTRTATATDTPLTERWWPIWLPGRKIATHQSLWACRARFVSVQAGRRSLKTELGKRRLVAFLRIPIPNCPKPRYVFAGPTREQSKKVAWQDLLDLIPDAWIEGGKTGPNVSYSTLTIETVYGSSVQVVGLDRPKRIEGGYLNGIVVTESSDIRPGTFNVTIGPMLTDYHGWAWREGACKRHGDGAAEFNKFHDDCASGSYPDGAAFWWKSSDVLPEEELAHARATMAPADYREQYEASRETIGGGVFQSFAKEYNVRPCQYAESKPLVIGCDFNVNPMAWVVGHRYQNRLEFFDEIWLNNSSTQGALEVLWQRYHGHGGGFEFYGDASGQARKSSAAASDYLQIDADPRFKRAGRSVHFPSANPPVVDRIAACNAMLCNADGDRRLFVAPQCTHLIDDLLARHYRPYTREIQDGQSDLGHITDAASYVVWRLFPYGEAAQHQTRVIARR